MLLTRDEGLGQPGLGKVALGTGNNTHTATSGRAGKPGRLSFLTVVVIIII